LEDLNRRNAISRKSYSIERWDISKLMTRLILGSLDFDDFNDKSSSEEDIT
jgi:hypothetical protein